MSDEKKDRREQEKGDKGHAARQKAKAQQENPSPVAGSGGRGGHRRRTGGNSNAGN